MVLLYVVFELLKKLGEKQTLNDATRRDAVGIVKHIIMIKLSVQIQSNVGEKYKKKKLLSEKKIKNLVTHETSRHNLRCVEDSTPTVSIRASCPLSRPIFTSPPRLSVPLFAFCGTGRLAPHELFR